MEEIKQNKMAVEPLGKLFWKMGLPMIVSMVLQALYNVVDSIFVANMQGTGALANEALTYAFPIQILIIAIGVGTERHSRLGKRGFDRSRRFVRNIL